MQTYRRLLGYLRPHLGTFMVGVLGMVMFAATDAGWAAFVKFFLDGTFVDRDPRMVWLVPTALIGLFLVRGVGDFLQTYAPGSVGRRIVKTLRAQIFDRYLHLPVGYFDRNSAGVLLSKLTYNTEQVATATTDSITVFIRDTLTILGLIGYLLYMNWRLTLFALTVGPIIAFLIRRVNTMFRRYSRRIQNSMGDVTRVAKEAIEAPRVVRVFNAQEYETRLFEEVIEHNRRSHMKLLLTKGLSNPIVQAIAATGLAGVLYLATLEAIEGRMTVGEFTSFIAALMLITAPLRRLVNVAGPLQQGIAAAQSIFEVLDTPPEPAGGSRSLARARGEVEYREAHFRYPTAVEDVLRGVSFRVEPGQTIAIVGRSGSGKSTIVNLLPRFYDVTGGQVLLDGHDIRDYRAARPAPPDQRRQPGRRAVQRHDPQQHRLRPPGRARRDRSCSRGGEGARVCRRTACGPRDRGRRPWRTAVRRPAPADRDRPRAAAQHTDPDPRRGHFGARHRARAPDPGATRVADEVAHDAGDRAPALDGREGRPDPGHGRRPGDRAGHARRAARAGRAVLGAVPVAVQRMRLEAALQRLWYGPAWRSVPLWPLEALYRVVGAVRRMAYSSGAWRARRASRSVIVVGNLTVGGTGKTPVAAWLAQELGRAGHTVGVVLRGYGGTHRGAPRVVRSDDAPDEVGDEALLHARRGPHVVVIGADRFAAAETAAQAGADVIVCDDGLQHLALARDFEIVVADAKRGFGNGHQLPAGPLRESARRLESVDALVLTHRGPPGGAAPGPDHPLRVDVRLQPRRGREPGERRTALARFLCRRASARDGRDRPSRGLFRRLARRRPDARNTRVTRSRAAHGAGFRRRRRTADPDDREGCRKMPRNRRNRGRG